MRGGELKIFCLNGMEERGWERMGMGVRGMLGVRGVGKVRAKIKNNEEAEELEEVVVGVRGGEV